MLKYMGQNLGISGLHLLKSDQPYDMANWQNYTHLQVGGGIYTKAGKYLYKSWRIIIPFPELIVWADKTGFLKWEKR